MTIIDLTHYLLSGMAVAVLTLCVACPPPAFAEPEIAVQKTVYQVSGTTAAQIRQSLNRNSPVRQHGQSFDAYTRWDVDWRLRWAYDADGTCRPTTVSTLVRIHYTLPGLQGIDSLAVELAERWKRYMVELVAHEEGHAKMGIEAAREIEQQLSVLGQRSSCDQLDAEAKALVSDIIARYSLLDDQYDTDILYDQRTGPRFP